VFISGQITLVCIGPLTNVAVALRIDSVFGKKLRQCIIMGGNTTGNQSINQSMYLLTAAKKKRTTLLKEYTDVTIN